MSLPPLETISLNAGTIGYREAGAGPTLFLMHGLAGNSRSWIHQFDAFSTTHRVIAWDAPGYGGSDDFSPDVDVFADTLDEVRSYLGIDQMILLGHSMGGVVAGRYAARYPEHLSGLILSCTHTGNGAAKGKELPPGYKNRVQDIQTMSARDYGRSRAKAMLAPGTASEIFDMAADISAQARPSGLANAARVIVEADNAPGLSQLELPTLIISGEVDPVVGKDKTDRLASLVAGARTEVIAGAGHAPYLEKPGPYNATLKEFLTSL